MWEKFKNTKFYQFIHKNWILVTMILFVILIIIFTALFIDAKKDMVKYTEGLVTQKAFDSIQKENSLKADSLRFQDMLLGKRLDSVNANDRTYIEQILAEQEWFKNYEKIQYEKINSIRNVGSPELQRLYANFEE